MRTLINSPSTGHWMTPPTATDVRLRGIVIPALQLGCAQVGQDLVKVAEFRGGVFV